MAFGSSIKQGDQNTFPAERLLCQRGVSLVEARQLIS
jgi:hypothetical protein